MRKKEILAIALDRLLPDSVLPTIFGCFSNSLTVLAYHRVVDFDKESYPFDDDLVSASSSDFEFQVKYIKKYFNPITMEQLIKHVEHNLSLPKRALLLTFDDGFDDNYFAAFPILKKLDVPATIFVSTGFIDTEEIIWFDKLSALILAFEGSSIFLDELGKTYQLGNDKASRCEVVADILYDIKRISNNQRLSLLDNLNSQNVKVFENIDRGESRMMNWQQVREMNDSIISFGSHTVSHPILSKLNKTQLKYELVESKSVLEKELGSVVGSISYPDGNEEAFSESIIEQVKKADYKVAFSYIAGTNKFPLKDLYAIKRLHVEHYMSRSHFKALLCVPEIFREH